MMNVMRFLGMLAGSFEQSKTSEIFHHFVWINSKHQGIFYAKHRVGECVKPKQFLGEIRDYSGTVLQSVLSPVEGRILFLVTSPAMKEGSVLMGVGTKEV
jgi:predicted deacylase